MRARARRPTREPPPEGRTGRRPWAERACSPRASARRWALAPRRSARRRRTTAPTRRREEQPGSRRVLSRTAGCASPPVSPTALPRRSDGAAPVRTIGPTARNGVGSVRRAPARIPALHEQVARAGRGAFVARASRRAPCFRLRDLSSRLRGRRSTARPALRRVRGTTPTSNGSFATGSAAPPRRGASRARGGAALPKERAPALYERSTAERQTRCSRR